jgi:anti-anti-sigma factor
MNNIFSLEQDKDKSVLHVSKQRLFAEDTEKFKQECDEVLPQLEGEKVILDLDGVDYVSSLILAYLVYMLKKITESNKTFALSKVNPKVLELLQVTKLDKVFEITTD